MAKRGAGEGNIRRRGNGLWEARYRDPASGQRKSVYGKTRKTVAERLAAALAGVEDPRPTRRTDTFLKTHLDEWLKTQDVQTRTRAEYKRLLGHWSKHLGNATLASLTADAVRGAQRAITEDAGRTTARSATNVLRRALRRSIARGRVRPDVLEDLKIPTKGKRQRRRLLDDTEVARVRKAARGSKVETLVEVLLGTGLRFGEALGLQWRDVDLRDATLRVERTLVETDAGELYFADPKTETSCRTVELPQAVVAALRAHRGRIGATPLRDVLVFPDRRGGPMRRSNLTRRHWHPLLRRAGFGAETFGFHVLRHSHGSHLVARGADIAAVSARLGHSDISFTYRVYVHPIEQSKKRARCITDAWLAESDGVGVSVGVRVGEEASS